MMMKNIGILDRWIRVVVGMIFMGLGYYYSMPWLYIISAIAFITALLGWCFLYQVLGISTCPVPQKQVAVKNVAKSSKKKSSKKKRR